jgi:hypothetical protein
VDAILEAAVSDARSAERSSAAQAKLAILEQNGTSASRSPSFLCSMPEPRPALLRQKLLGQQRKKNEHFKNAVIA